MFSNFLLQLVMFWRGVLAVGVVLLALWVGGFLSTPRETPHLQDGWWGRGPMQPDAGIPLKQ